MRIYFDLSDKEAAMVSRSLRQLVEDAAPNSDERAALEKMRAAVAEDIDAVERRLERYAGHIEWTLEDEAYEPHGRQFDIRVYYDWVDFDPGDQTTPPSGGHAEIAAIEVLRVSYFNARGEVIPAADHELEAAWDLLARYSGPIESACSDDGKSAGMEEVRGRSPRKSILRRAPSARERFRDSHRRASG